MHIAVDMDDVVVDFTGGLRSAVRVEYGITIPPEAIDKWDLHEVLDPIIGRSWWVWLREREWLWANFPAVDGAIGALDLLRRQGHYLEIITSKPQWAEHNVWKWLGKWRPPIQQVTIVGKDDPKVDFTTADILIDDKASNCQGFVNADRAAILFSRPHNLTEALLGRRDQIAIARGWSEVLTLIEEYPDGWK